MCAEQGLFCEEFSPLGNKKRGGGSDQLKGYF